MKPALPSAPLTLPIFHRSPLAERQALRLHGRKSWHSHVYGEEDFRRIAESVQSEACRKKYIYLNNDDAMIPNGEYMRSVLNFPQLETKL